jgi:outer membrane protein W
MMRESGSPELVLEEIYNSSATSSTTTGVISGASVHVTNNTNVLFDIGYYPSSNTFITHIAGWSTTQAGSKWSRDGRSIRKTRCKEIWAGNMTASYRIPFPGKLQPYVGVGAAYAISLHNHDDAVSSLDLHNNFGYAL